MCWVDFTKRYDTRRGLISGTKVGTKSGGKGMLYAFGLSVKQWFGNF
jgi:hypothetical protein